MMKVRQMELVKMKATKTLTQMHLAKDEGIVVTITKSILHSGCQTSIINVSCLKMLCTLYYRFDESAILKRRERRLWEEKRTKILFEYQQFSDYGSSTALLMYELAWKMSRDTNDLVSTKELFLLILCAQLNTNYKNCSYQSNIYLLHCFVSAMVGYYWTY